MTLIWGLQQLTMEDVEGGWTHVMEIVNTLEEEKPSGRLGKAEAARYSREVALVRMRRELETRRAQEEDMTRRAQQDEKTPRAQETAPDEFVFVAADEREVDEMVGGSRRVVLQQGEATQKTSRNKKRRARKRQADQEEKKDLEEGKTTEEDVRAAKERRKAEEEEKVNEKLGRSGHMARWDEKLEALEKKMDLQRKEDAKAWRLEVAGLQAVIARQGAVIARQGKVIVALKEEVEACFHCVPGQGREARRRREEQNRPSDPRQATPRQQPSIGGMSAEAFSRP